jgi:hypothetical protein
MGYLLNDDSASGGKRLEWDTVSCRHCQAVIKVERRQHQGAYCMKCGGPVCNTPRCATECAPFRRRLEQQIKARERRQRFWDHVSLAGALALIWLFS